MDPRTEPTTPTCYRHPDRETNLRCAECDRPICTSCMRNTPVGQKCPDCAGSQKVVRPFAMDKPVVTYALIAINVLVFVLLEGGLRSTMGISNLTLYDVGGLYSTAVANGDWWRGFSSMFMHGSLIHIGFNMYVLYQIGPMLETVFGRLRYLLLYLTAGIGGAVGVMLMTPHAVTTGASGAIFGLMGAIAVLELQRTGRISQNILFFIGINLVFTFALPGIAIGGHIGGLITGCVVTFIYEAAGKVRQPSMRQLASVGTTFGILVALQIALIVIAVAAG